MVVPAARPCSNRSDTVPLRGDRVSHHVNHISVAAPEHAVGPLWSGQGVGVAQHLHKPVPLVGRADHGAHPAVSGREDPVVPVGVATPLVGQLGKVHHVIGNEHRPRIEPGQGGLLHAHLHHLALAVAAAVHYRGQPADGTEHRGAVVGQITGVPARRIVPKARQEVPAG